MFKLLVLDRTELRSALASSDLLAGASIEWISEIPTAASDVSAPIIVSVKALLELQRKIRSERIDAFAQLSRGLGHELGNILLRIVGKTDLALMEGDLDRVREHLRGLMEASDRATLVVRNLQSYGRTQFHLRPVEVGGVVSESLATLRGDAERFGVKVEWASGSPIQVAADRASLLQAICNVALNGIQASSSGGALSVSLERVQSGGQPGVCICIKDSGPGIPEPDRTRIFEFGFTTRGGRGAGLGLSAAREIIQAHRGTLELVASSSSGSEFHVVLPELSGSRIDAPRKP